MPLTDDNKTNQKQTYQMCPAQSRRDNAVSNYALTNLTPNVCKLLELVIELVRSCAMSMKMLIFYCTKTKCEATLRDAPVMSG